VCRRSKLLWVNAAIWLWVEIHEWISIGDAALIRAALVPNFELGSNVQTGDTPPLFSAASTNHDNETTLRRQCEPTRQQRL
jgi:hypothetical protein